MKILISPAKSLNYDIEAKVKSTKPNFLDDSKKLNSILKKMSQAEIGKLMKISENLSELNYKRYQEFQTPFTDKNAKPAIFVFNGDVYDAITPEKYNEKQLNFAQNSLRILSGLYGILRPLDLMQPYRLEMSTKLENEAGKDLYEFWQEKLTKYLNEEESELIINLASNEYFSAINAKNIKAKIINVIFKEKKGDQFKIIGIHAKKARGMMVNFLIENQIEKVEKIKDFKEANYSFNSKLSDQNNLVFTR